MSSIATLHNPGFTQASIVNSNVFLPKGNKKDCLTLRKVSLSLSLSPAIFAYLCTLFLVSSLTSTHPFRALRGLHGRQPPGTLSPWPVSHKAPRWQVKKDGQCILPLICSLTSANNLLGGHRIWPRKAMQFLLQQTPIPNMNA